MGIATDLMERDEQTLLPPAREQREPLRGAEGRDQLRERERLREQPREHEPRKEQVHPHVRARSCILRRGLRERVGISIRYGSRSLQAIK